MKKSTLFLNELEVALRYWEEMNLVSEIFFDLSIKGDPILEHYKYEKPLVGTELDEKKYLARSVKDFKNFRKCVESKIEFDPSKFLPRVSKSEREILDQINFMRAGISRMISSYPYFLCNWLKYKKVYVLPSPDTIKEVSTEKKNFLPLLPYGSFVVKFEEPMSFDFDNGNIQNYNVMMLNLDEKDNVIDMVLLRSDLKDFLLEEKDEKMLLDKRKKSWEKMELKPEIELLGISLTVEDARIVEKILHTQSENGEEIHPHFIDLRPENTDEFIIVLYTFLRDKINGFCKLISELSPRKVILEESKETTETIAQKLEEYEWKAVPITEVRNIKKLGGEIYISNLFTGSEKSPHWRRGHWRNIKKANGSFVRKWIDQMLIREDKLETGNLKGGATRITDEE